MGDTSVAQSRPTLVPGIAAGLVLVGGIWILQAMASAGAVQDMLERDGVPSFGQNLFGFGLGFFGPDLRALTLHPSYAVGAITATVAMFAVVTGVVWLGGRYVIPSGGLAIFVIAWFASCLACATGIAVNVVVRSALSPSPRLDYAFDLLGAAPRVGGEWGMTYGWIPAGVALLVWILGSPRPSRNVLTSPPAPVGD
ncbi:hypothetical protein [Nocardioides albus]|uniref:Uncharacterized protein n=1 Tax=Nocardioides albus TaxID=1841 RepID=A0A7W5A725_9ACTN|nr:hypothetical protein [Nocardioides albus]MBB3090913.1 hypothetical protein [Nocardioides albus]GGU38340.1 hypothetical protein GCM10007979_41860 [Nocardioides albus]